MPFINHDKMNLTVSCPRGLEEPLAEEIGQITGKEAIPRDGRVDVHCGYADMVRINMKSRLASRVLLLITKRRVQNEEEIYQAVYRVPWHELFKSDSTIKVRVESKNARVRSINFVVLKIKDALCDRFRDETGVRPDVDKKDPDVRVSCFLDDSFLHVYVDTTGESLFKRGYRLDNGIAPLRENLAAGLLKLAGYDGKNPFFDPMTGSGTIAIEAALMQRRIYPGAKRKFGFEHLFDCDQDLVGKIRAEVEAERIDKGDFAPIWAGDINKNMLAIAQRNAEAAGVIDCINFISTDMNVLERPIESDGLLLCNPPYGERLDDVEMMRDSYPHWASRFKKAFSGWVVAVISSDMSFPKYARLKPRRKVPVYNGKLECRLFIFDMVEGSNRKPK